MRETLDGLRDKIIKLENSLAASREYTDRVERLRIAEAAALRSTNQAFERSNLRLTTRNDALQWALCLAQASARRSEESLKKCEELLNGMQASSIAIAG